MTIEPGSDLRSNVGQEECLIHSFLGVFIDEKRLNFIRYSMKSSDSKGTHLRIFRISSRHPYKPPRKVDQSAIES